jgi:hypothetical protein
LIKLNGFREVGNEGIKNNPVNNWLAYSQRLWWRGWLEHHQLYGNRRGDGGSSFRCNRAVKGELMNRTTPNFKSLAFSLLALGAVPLSALATPPTTSPYATDPQNSYVQDATSDGISNLNMVLCIMDAMKPADMVNQGNYIALIDMNKCDTKSQSSTSNSTSGSSGATTAPNYMTATVNVSRASNSDPMIGNIWMSMTEEGQAMDIDVHVTATQSPTDAPPYGQFRLDYIGKTAGASPTTQFNGYIDANGANVSYFENGQNSSNNALALQAASTVAASGTMQAMDYNQSPPAPVTFNFAYDASETGFPAGIFRRDHGTNDVCFDRSKAAAHKSVWRYGTYNDTDGTRVDQANPGFPVLATSGGQSYFGYASYWGVNFQGLDLNSFADGQLSNVTIADQRPNNTETYTLYKNSGKLTKWSQNQSTLAAMDGIPFTFWGDLTNQTTDTTNVTGFGSWEMQWNNDPNNPGTGTGTFSVIGAQTCNNGPCTLTALTTPATVTGTIFDNAPVSGWSDSFGGNINIPPHVGGGARVGNDNVYFYSQSDVVPGSSTAPTALYCLNNCPTATSISGFTGSNSPFDSATTTQWNSGTTTVSYGFGASGLVDSSAPSSSLAITNTSLFSGQYQNGVQSGRLFPTALSNADCPGGTPSGTVCEPPNPATYYTWQTGPNQWNQSLWLVKASDSSVVSFDPPQNVSYTVPTGTEYGTWAGKTIQLQFNGFGNLQGIPGTCVNPLDNSPADCSTAGSRYVPAFSIPDGATMTLTGLTSGSIPLIVKALDSEIRLNKVANCSGVTLAQPTASLTLPDASGLHDPSSSTDIDYVGVKPTVTDAPKVIDGVIQ